MEITIHYVKDFIIGKPIVLLTKNKKRFYQREISIVTTEGLEKMILNSYNKDIISIEGKNIIDPYEEMIKKGEKASKKRKENKEKSTNDK